MSATGLIRSTLCLRIKQRLMVPMVKLGERCVAWPEHEVGTIDTARIAGESEAEIRELVTQLEQ